MNPATQTPRNLGTAGNSFAFISSHRRWSVVGLLFMASLINYLDRSALSVALPQISAEFALGPAKKGLLLSAFFWSYAVMQVPMGWLADRVNLLWLYAGSFALWSFACGLTGFAGSLAVLIVLRIALGIGESIYLPGGTRLISELFAPQDRGFPTGIFDAGTRAGLALGAPLVAWLTTRFSWRSMFSLIGFSSLLWLLPWILAFPPEFRQLHSRFSPRRTASPGFRKGVITIDRNLLGACLGFFCFGYYAYLLVTWLPDYLVQVRHLTTLKAGVYASLPYFVWGLSEPAGGWIADRMIRHGYDETRVRKGIITVAFMAGLLLIPAMRAMNAGMTIALVAGASLVGVSSANLLVVFQCCAPREEIAVWTGMGNFIGNIGGVLSPLVTGLLIGRTGSYSLGFGLASFVLMAGVIPYWLIVGELKSAS